MSWGSSFLSFAVVYAMRCLVFAALLTGASWGAEDAPPLGRLPDTVTPLRYTLSLTIDPSKTELTGRCEIVVRVNRPTRSIWLHGQGLKVQSAKVETPAGGRAGIYEEVDTRRGVARLSTYNPIPGGEVTLRFEYTAPILSAADALYRVKTGEDWYAFTQMQAISARRVFPGFDEPGFKTPFTVSVIAREGDKVIANAPLEKSTPAEAGYVLHQFKPSLPLPTYLLAFAVGPFDIVEAPDIAPNAQRKQPVPLRGIAMRGQGGRFAQALRATPALVERFEQYFGIAYPYPKLDLIAAGGKPGAMENAGAITFNDTYILLNEDAPLQQVRYFAYVTAHEIAHHWFGNLVTPQWWDDIWLNEGFADWIAVKTVDGWRPELAVGTQMVQGGLETMNTDSQFAGRPIRERIDDSTRIDSAFDSITYTKGARVLAMIESYLGEETFRRGVQAHLAAHPHGTATSDDFFGALAKAARKPRVIDAFRSFVSQPGVPLITVRGPRDGRLELTQSRYKPLGSAIGEGAHWTIPFCATLYSPADGQKSCTLIGRKGGSIELPARGANGVVMPNAQGAGYYRFSLEADAMEALLARATQLPENEALALADSVRAAFRAGTLSGDSLLAAASSLAAHPQAAAATQLGMELMQVQNRMLESAQWPAAREALRRIYQPRLTEIGLNPRAGAYPPAATEQHLLRGSLAQLVAVGGRDAEFRRVLLEAAHASLKDSSALDTQWRELAWTVAGQEAAPGFVNAMIENITSSPDALVRSHARSALSAVGDPVLSEKILALVLDERVNEVDAVVLLRGRLLAPETRDAAWKWTSANVDALFKRSSGGVQNHILTLPGAFCDRQHRAEVERVLSPKVEELGLGPLELSRTLERIDLCIAQKDARREEFRAKFGG